MTDFERLYSFDLHEERTIKILTKFGLNKYHFVTTNGVTSLIVMNNLNSYRIEPHIFKGKMVVYKKNIKYKNNRPKEYMDIVASYSNDCIYSAIKYVANDDTLILN